jgi:leucyl aminopeptidase
MSDLLPDQATLRITRSPTAPDRRALDGLDHLLVVLPRQPSAATWKKIPEGARLHAQWRRLAADDPPPLLRSRLANRSATAITVGALPEDWADPRTTYPELKFAADLAAVAHAERARRIGVLVAGVPQERARRLRQTLVLALGAASFQLPAFRSRARRRPAALQVQLFQEEPDAEFARTLAEIEAVNLVRWLTALPANKLTTVRYRELLAALAEHHDWSMRWLDQAALERLGAGAFLAVARGSLDAGAGIAHLAYRPRGRRRPDVALVGKGVIFDTGGTNLKSFRPMLDMHQDMCGSAVAVATLLAITRLKLPLAVDCWLAISENRPGPQAYKPRDVVTAANGTSIEVIHTDAEGRMLLADTLALAARERPRLLIDYATLTGQCINALTERYSGVFTNRAGLDRLLTETGRDCGERVWPFPLDEDFDEEIRSEVADVAQCSADNEGDHILAARFLRRFVPQEIPWAHVDLSSATRKKGLGQVPPGPTGFGVRLTLALLADRHEELSALLAPAGAD